MEEVKATIEAVLKKNSCKTVVFEVEKVVYRFLKQFCNDDIVAIKQRYVSSYYPVHSSVNMQFYDL